MKSFLTFKIINSGIFLYLLKKSSYSETWQNTQFMTAILFCFIFTPSRGEYLVIVRDSEPIRLLESPRSLSVYILILYILMSIHLPQLQHPKGVLTTQDTSCITDNVVYYFTCIKRPSIVYIGEMDAGWRTVSEKTAEMSSTRKMTFLCLLSSTRPIIITL